MSGCFGLDCGSASEWGDCNHRFRAARVSKRFLGGAGGFACLARLRAFLSQLLNKLLVAARCYSGRISLRYQIVALRDRSAQPVTYTSLLEEQACIGIVRQ
jgi:hypothetical protein